MAKEPIKKVDAPTTAFKALCIELDAKRQYAPTATTIEITDEDLVDLKVCKVVRINREGKFGKYTTTELLLNDKSFNLDPLTTNIVAGEDTATLAINKSSIRLTLWDPTANNTNENAIGRYRASFELLEA